MVKFSFLMCINRNVPFLAAAIDSVLTQTSPDFLFYIIANNCDDDLWDALKKYQDPRLRLHRTLIGQLSFNLNYGLNLIGDGYVLRMDADDICLPQRLELTRKFLIDFSYPDVMGGDAILIDENDVKIGHARSPIENDAIRSLLWRKCPMIHPTCAINVRSILKLRGYLGGFMSEDYDLWLRASRDKKFIFRNIGEPLIKYRISADQARGNVLGYSEVAGFMLREALLGRGVKFFMAAFFGILKRYFRSKNLDNSF